MPTRVTTLLPVATTAVALAFFTTIVGADVGSRTITGNGKVTTEARTVTAFTTIGLRGSVDLEFQIGPTVRVEVKGESNLLPYVSTKVDDHELVIGLERSDVTSIRTTKPLLVTVTAPTLAALSTSGSGDASALGLSGEDLHVTVRGSGDVRLSGSATQVRLRVQGSGSIDAKDLIASTAAASVRGSGDIHVHAKKAVAAAVRGSGDIVIYGAPSTISRDVSGSGEIHLHQ
jgi:hypothetical protein